MADNQAFLWDPAKKQKQKLMLHTESVTAVFFVKSSSTQLKHVPTVNKIMQEDAHIMATK